jgi:hypothetical protein
MNTSKQRLKISILWIVILIYCGIPADRSLNAQVFGPHEYKWLRVGSLHTWISNAGAEIEYGRRGRAAYLNTDQTDGLAWPAQYRYQDHCAAKSLRIGTTNFADPVTGETYPYKVVSCGSRIARLENEMMPLPNEFVMVGKDFGPPDRESHPDVIVDGLNASDNVLNDEVDIKDNDLRPDRLIISKLHTSIGVSITRKIMAFSNPYHDNYFITEYIFKNTGIIDLNDTQLDPVPQLTDVIFHFQYRYAFAYEAYRNNWSASGVSWGRNTVNDVIGENSMADGAPFRALISWYGPHSQNAPWEADVGAPDQDEGSVMAGTQYVGVVVLHADRSPEDQSDDPEQPTTTQYLGSDNDAQGVDQYDEDLMTRKYEFMTMGHPALSHAEEVGVGGYADGWGTDPGGYSQAQGFGPYTLDEGDSIRIVLAEGINGINRLKNLEIMYNWFNENAPYRLPDGTTTSDRNQYKNAWVWSGRDSLMQTFARAVSNFENNYVLDEPPPPPDKFELTSGGDRIFIEWSASAEDWPGFDGYELYRAVDTPDTTYDLIFSCNAANKVNIYEDKQARRGFDYYYYIITKDDGTNNTVYPGVPLKSSKFYTMTNQPAFLRRPPGKSLADIRVVPNPYNIRAQSLQFGINNPDRIAFYGLPPFCTIKIFTERGDLIQSLDHTDSSGDELWDQLTFSRQLVVSGLYIAYFEVTKDYRDERTGRLVYKKGENTFRKFIIIR